MTWFRRRPRSLSATEGMSVLLFLTLLVLGGCQYLGGSAPQSLAEQPIVLEGATLIDGLGGSPIADAVLVIEGEKIQSILQGKGQNYPSESIILDVSGRFIIPGLLESHVHWEDWMGELYLNHGVTSVVALADLGEERRITAQSSLTGPRLFHRGARVRLTPAMSREEILQWVAGWRENKPDMAHFPTFNESIRQQYGWAAEEVHRAGYLIFGHAEDAPAAIEAGLDVVEHVWGFTQAQMSPQELEGFQEGLFLTWATFTRDWPRLDQMIQTAVNRGVYLNPTLLYEWAGMSDQATAHEYEDYLLFQHPDLSYFPQNIAASLLLKHRQIKNFSSRYGSMPIVTQLPAQDFREFKDGYRKVQEFVRRFVQAGGKIHSGTDAPSGGTPGLSLHHEMELLVEAGLKPMQALQASTSWPAEMLAGRGGVRRNPGVGSIQEGNFADLVILKANPLEDIGNSKKIERVMKGGRFVDRRYHPDYFTFVSPPRSISGATPVPEISSISPHLVTEGDPEFTMVIEGVGFVGTSVVRVDGITLSTRFEGPGRLRVKIPADLVESASPNRFSRSGPAQNLGALGDRTLSIEVYNPPPEGGISNSVSLIVSPRWKSKAE